MLKNQKWTILLWSVFLVLFISFSFLYISQEINKKIKQNQRDVFLSSNAQTSQVFTNIFSWTLKKQEKLNFYFETPNSWSIILKNGAPIYYETFNNSWIIQEKNRITSTTSISNFSSWIILLSLGWLSKFEIKFNSTTWIIFPYNYKKTIKNIWGSEMVESVVME